MKNIGSNAAVDSFFSECSRTAHRNIFVEAMQALAEAALTDPEQESETGEETKDSNVSDDELPRSPSSEVSWRHL